MYFNSVSDFLYMDGHGVYVWASYGMTVITILFNLIMPSIKRKRLLKEMSQLTYGKQDASST